MVCREEWHDVELLVRVRVALEQARLGGVELGLPRVPAGDGLGAALPPRVLGLEVEREAEDRRRHVADRLRLGARRLVCREELGQLGLVLGPLVAEGPAVVVPDAALRDHHAPRVDPPVGRVGHVGERRRAVCPVVAVVEGEAHPVRCVRRQARRELRGGERLRVVAAVDVLGDVLQVGRVEARVRAVGPALVDDVEEAGHADRQVGVGDPARLELVGEVLDQRPQVRTARDKEPAASEQVARLLWVRHRVGAAALGREGVAVEAGVVGRVEGSVALAPRLRLLAPGQAEQRDGQHVAASRRGLPRREAIYRPIHGLPNLKYLNKCKLQRKGW